MREERGITGSLPTFTDVRDRRAAPEMPEPLLNTFLTTFSGNVTGIITLSATPPIDFTLGDRDPMMVSLEHIIPLSRGGEHSYANTALSHLRCNLSKGAKMPAELHQLTPTSIKEVAA